MLIGYEAELEKFEKGLPQALLIRGMEGVGKFELAVTLAQKHAKKYDIVENKGTLSIDKVREIVKFASFVPFGSPVRVIIVETDEASPSALNALLKVLEEANDKIRFIIVSASDNLPLTIVSRCFTCDLAPLSDEQVQKVLMSRGVMKSVAEKAAKGSQGSVKDAFGLLEEDTDMEEVLSIINYILDKDITMVVRSSRKWSDVKMRLFEGILWKEMDRRFGIPIRSSAVQEVSQKIFNLSLERMDAALVFCRRRIRPSLKILICAYILGG